MRDDKTLKSRNIKKFNFVKCQNYLIIQYATHFYRFFTNVTFLTN